RSQSPHARVISEHPHQLAVQPLDLERQSIDHLQIGLDAGARQLGPSKLLKELATALPKRSVSSGSWTPCSARSACTWHLSPERNRTSAVRVRTRRRASRHAGGLIHA